MYIYCVLSIRCINVDMAKYTPHTLPVVLSCKHVYAMLQSLCGSRTQRTAHTFDGCTRYLPLCGGVGRIFWKLACWAFEPYPGAGAYADTA